MSDVFDLIGLELIEDQVARHPFKAELIAPLGRTLSEMWELLWQVQRRHCEAPTTLLHGDPHLGNTYLLPGGRAGLLDWQLMMRGSWAHDVTYLLVTALPPEVRRAHQHELLGEYLDLLAAGGVDDAPEPAEAFEQCRAAALWGLVIGWLICPPENYGEADHRGQHLPHRHRRAGLRHHRQRSRSTMSSDDRPDDTTDGHQVRTDEQVLADQLGDPGPRHGVRLRGRRPRLGPLGGAVHPGRTHRLHVRRWDRRNARRARCVDARRHGGLHVLSAHDGDARDPLHRT